MNETIRPKNKSEQRDVLIIMLRYLLDNKNSNSKNSEDNKDIVEKEIEEMEIGLEEKDSEDFTIQYFFDKESEETEIRGKNVAFGEKQQTLGETEDA